ncbi:MAG: hypothetical protein ACI8RZ_006943 [Myxococcota bacterium]|jgi:hypothetical protein
MSEALTSAKIRVSASDLTGSGRLPAYGFAGEPGRFS